MLRRKFLSSGLTLLTYPALGQFVPFSIWQKRPSSALFLGNYSNYADSSNASGTYSFSSVPTGVAKVDRVMIVAAYLTRSNPKIEDITEVRVDSSLCTPVVVNSTDGNLITGGIFVRAIPTGTSATVEVVAPGTSISGCAILVAIASGIMMSSFDTMSSIVTSGGASGTINVPQDGILLTSSMHSSWFEDMVWSGVTERIDASSVDPPRYSLATIESTAAETNRAISETGGSNECLLLGASFSPS